MNFSFDITKTTNADEALGKMVRDLADKINQNYIEREIRIKEKTNQILIVDLGNIHDLLPIVDKQRDIFDRYTVWGFCDLHYNGYGVNPLSTHSEIIRAGGSKNAADVNIIWHISRMCSEAKYTFHIVTKDKGFTEVESLCKRSGSYLHFYSSTKAFIDAIDQGKIHQKCHF